VKRSPSLFLLVLKQKKGQIRKKQAFLFFSSQIQVNHQSQIQVNINKESQRMGTVALKNKKKELNCL
tara:strand:- start:344 stop:544 length:201 start_codon:yes stop_codon:yes gene_type:complete